MSNWLRHRFKANYDDSRPVKFPPPGPYWETGLSGNGDYAIVVAWFPANVQVTDWWPEATDIESTPEGPPTYTSRFTCPTWWRQ
jgi:hypothetical protein